MLRDLGIGAAVAALAASAATAAASTESGTLAFARGGDIYTVDLATKRVHAVVATRALEHSPTYSRDGKVAYVVDRAGNADVYVDGRRVTRSAGADYSPAWSPDGTRIAFSSNRGGVFRIYVMRANGSGVRLVTRAAESYTPAWSPDAKWIAFSSSARTPENPELYVVRPDGSGLRRLTFTKGDVDTLGDDAWPTWSPDGKRIAFSSNRTGDGEVWVMNANGTAQRRIAGLPKRDDWAPAWSPDGTRIAFHSLDAVGRTELYLVRPDGRALKRPRVGGEGAAWVAS